jgi:two-component system, NarL family, response regulator LiaR
MPKGQPKSGSLRGLLRSGECSDARLLGMARAVDYLLTEIRRIREVLHRLAPRVVCPGVALAGEVWGNARNHRRRSALVALLCATLMAQGVIGATGGRPPTSSGVTRVLVVDDHPLLRRGITASLLSVPGFEVVGQVGSGEEAVEQFAQVRPDIVLMDLVMPGMGGAEAIRAIRRIDPEAKIMVVTTYEEGDRVKEALQAGAIGYQLKGGDIDELVEAIRQAVHGIPSLAPAAARSLVRMTIKAPKLGDDLTDRERELLELLAKGLPNTGIATQMVVTVATVKFHLRSVRTKLGTKTRTETVAVAIQHHLIPGTE